jgi:poly-beta-1,6-N-acetyl-D-glucosamine synthase
MAWFKKRALAHRRGAQRSETSTKGMNYKPFVSVVFSSYNEEKYIGDKIKNILSSDYPKDKMEILVGSDGSTDGTNKIISEVSNNKNVRAFMFKERRGKISVISDLIKEAKGDILVFCDTRQIFGKEAIGHLVANFNDKKIGCVSGELMFERDEENTGVSTGVGVYWSYEKIIREAESQAHSMIGATGAIYAIRRELYKEPPLNTILDDVYIPLAVVRRGYRSIVDENAKAYDKPARYPREEYRRKVRTLAGNYQIFSMFRDLLVPFKSPVFVPFFSHKLLRIIAPFFIIALFLTSAALARQGLYRFALAAQIVFYALAVSGGLLYHAKRRSIPVKLAYVAFMFCEMNLAALAGLYRFVFGKQGVVWEK